jgi:hypothetical protein
MPANDVPASWRSQRAPLFSREISRAFIKKTHPEGAVNFFINHAQILQKPRDVTLPSEAVATVAVRSKGL